MADIEIFFIAFNRIILIKKKLVFIIKKNYNLGAFLRTTDAPFPQSLCLKNFLWHLHIFGLVWFGSGNFDTEVEYRLDQPKKFKDNELEVLIH